VPPDWGGEGFLHGNYVNLETAIFFIFGPHLLAMILVNATFAGATIVLIADIARRVFGRAASVAAAVVLAVVGAVVLLTSGGDDKKETTTAAGEGKAPRPRTATSTAR